METDLIYVKNDREYIMFFCGTCGGAEAKLITIRPDEPQPSTDLKNIIILGFDVKCPVCEQEHSFKMNLMGIEARGVGTKD